MERAALAIRVREDYPSALQRDPLAARLEGAAQQRCRFIREMKRSALKEELPFGDDGGRTLDARRARSFSTRFVWRVRRHELTFHQSRGAFRNPAQKALQLHRGEPLFLFGSELRHVPGSGRESGAAPAGLVERGRRVFDVFVNDTKVATQTLQQDKPGEFFEVRYAIPFDLIKGKTNALGQKVDSVTVKFQAQKDAVAGGVFGIRTVAKSDGSRNTP
jgi:hypothetical protein